MKSDLLAILAVLALLPACLSQDKPALEDTNAPPRPNPVKLESLKSGIPPVPPPSAHVAPKTNAAPAKEMAIIIYGATVFQVNGQQVWVIPERYMEDMKRLYKFQAVPKAALPEP